jgi:hypothetical protein
MPPPEGAEYELQGSYTINSPPAAAASVAASTSCVLQEPAELLAGSTGMLLFALARRLRGALFLATYTSFMYVSLFCTRCPVSGCPG